MKNRIILEILLMCVLGFTGWYLHHKIELIKSTSSILKDIERYDQRMIFDGNAGIDVFGNKIESINKNHKEDIMVAFILRIGTLDSDLQFWNAVNGYLTDLDTVRMTAYCENDRCAEAIRKNNIVDFSIVEYGTIEDMQAMINADRNGQCLLRSKKAYDGADLFIQGTGFTKINWRDGNVSPFEIAMRISMAQ